jgi:hypothetical protein
MTIELTLDEVNQILNALGQRPYVEVANLISKIATQAQQRQETPAE